VHALTAQKWFEEHKPRWAPLLPLSVADCEKLESAGSSRLKLVGYYGRSQMASKWDKRHPSFADHACGVMASPSAPDHLRKDPGLMVLARSKGSIGSCAGTDPRGLSNSGNNSFAGGNICGRVECPEPPFGCKPPTS
jgi:hypothetical protein